VASLTDEVRERQLQRARVAYQRPEFGNQSIRYALVTMVLVNIWCATHYYIATRTLREDLARAPA
jgi:hypothetical protein